VTPVGQRDPLVDGLLAVCPYYVESASVGIPYHAMVPEPSATEQLIGLRYTSNRRLVENPWCGVAFAWLLCSDLHDELPSCVNFNLIAPSAVCRA